MTFQNDISANNFSFKRDHTHNIYLYVKNIFNIWIYVNKTKMYYIFKKLRVPSTRRRKAINT